ncbi:MAG: N-acetyl-gamma-glutamyl-phosphate reductase [Acidobacteriota bacterium]
MPNRTRIAIIGATGYSGVEMVGLLLKHPAVELHTLMTANRDRSSQKPRRYSEELPQFAERCDKLIEPLDFDLLREREIEIVLLATPNETSHELVPELVERGFRVIDLSGSFRLREAGLYPKWYGFEHRRAGLLESAVYGLTEWARERVRNAQLVANPGCYPTSVLLPLLPLQREGLVDEGVTIICDAKSGVSGAGKSPTANTHFSEVTESFKAYNVFMHRHSPEICQELGNPNLIFTPHLLPINRGILSTIYLRVKAGVSEKQVESCLRQAYANEPFVRLFGGVLPELKFTHHTNFCDIGWRLDPDRSLLVLVSSIDNLVKGAAGQAVQNLNVMLGCGETTALL